MRQVAINARQHRLREEKTLFLVAPYGPKPLGVAAHFVLQEYLASLKDPGYIEGEVLNSSGTQYLSVYSLGQRETSLMVYEPFDAVLPKLVHEVPTNRSGNSD